MTKLIRDRVVCIELEQQKLVKSRALKSESDARSAANVFVALAVFLAVLFSYSSSSSAATSGLYKHLQNRPSASVVKLQRMHPVGIILLDQQLQIAQRQSDDR